MKIVDHIKAKYILGLATTQYVLDAIAALVNSAPATLDTLKELADALGDDPNFATTVATNIAGKAPLGGSGASGTWTISVTGNAATATKLATARLIGGTSFDGSADIAVALSAAATKLATARAINGVNFDGTAPITVTAANPNALTIGTDLTGTSYTGGAAVTIAVTSASVNTVSTLVKRDASGNFAAGTITANLTGTASAATLAAAATKLATARTIGGTSFDGTGNIAVALATAATALATPRAINGVNFDGSAAITIADSTKVAKTGDTMTGALTMNTTTGVAGGMILSDTSAGAGFNIKMTGDGATTPSKFVRVTGGQYQIVNNAYSAAIMILTDAGNLSCGGSFASAGAMTAGALFTASGGITSSSTIQMNAQAILGCGNIGGSANNSAYSIWGGASTLDGGYIQLFGSTSGAPNTVQFGTAATTWAVLGAGGKWRMASYGAGTVVSDSSGNWTISSDLRLKTNVQDWNKGLTAILALTARSFNWTEASGLNPTDYNVGLIAQEVLATGFSEAVGYNHDRDEYSLIERPILMALVNAVKELSARVTALEGTK